MLQLGDDKWSLAGTTKIPKQRPEIVCRYGWVRSEDTGTVVARAVAFQLYDRYAYYILTPVWPHQNQHSGMTVFCGLLAPGQPTSIMDRDCSGPTDPLCRPNRQCLTHGRGWWAFPRRPPH